MSTRLERNAKLERERKIHPNKAREVVIAERNKEIRALQELKRQAERDLRWALAALELVYNGLKSRGLVDGAKPSEGDTEMWNLRVAKVSIEMALNRRDAASSKDKER